MSQHINIALPDDAYARLQQEGARTHQSPEALILAAVSERDGVEWLASADEVHGRAEDPMIAIMRANGHLVEPSGEQVPRGRHRR